MRIFLFTSTMIALCFIAGLVSRVAAGGDPLARYKIRLDLRNYPQTDPKKTLASVIRAVEKSDFEYLMAQLGDPEYVDKKVTKYMRLFNGPDDARAFVAFEKFADEVGQHFQRDPSLAAGLRRLAKNGVWKIEAKSALVRMPNATLRGAYFRYQKGRWYLENQRQAKNN